MAHYSVDYTVRATIDYDKGQLIDARARAFAAGVDLATVVKGDVRKALNRMPASVDVFGSLRIRTQGDGRNCHPAH